jgi:hypothetical protein
LAFREIGVHVNQLSLAIPNLPSTRAGRAGSSRFPGTPVPIGGDLPVAAQSFEKTMLEQIDRRRDRLGAVAPEFAPDLLGFPARRHA